LKCRFRILIVIFYYLLCLAIHWSVKLSWIDYRVLGKKGRRWLLRIVWLPPMWPKITYLYSKLYQHASYLILKLNMRVILLVCLVALALCRIKNSLTNWNFTYEKAKGWYPARIPSSLAWDLIDNKLVSNDPYFRDNFLQFYDF